MGPLHRRATPVERRAGTTQVEVVLKASLARGADAVAAGWRIEARGNSNRRERDTGSGGGNWDGGQGSGYPGGRGDPRGYNN